MGRYITGQLNARDLDNYITGHYGEDQFRDQDVAVDEAIMDDEGYAHLCNARTYLQYQEQDTEESCDVLLECTRLVVRDYECNFCARPVPDKHSYCSAQCASADAEGL